MKSFKIIRALIIIISLIVCFLLYKAYTSDLMADTVFYFICSLFLSFSTIILLLIVRRRNKEIFKKMKWLRLFAIFTGTPVIHILVYGYFATFRMNFEWEESSVSNSSHYSITKYQNFFRTKYYYYDAIAGKDTIVITITRADKIQNIAYLRNGIEIITAEYMPSKKEEFQKLGLLKY